MRHAEWAQRYPETGGWRRVYGTESAPVRVAAASPELGQACDLLDDLARGQRRCVLVQAPSGSGKSTLVAAALAVFAERGVHYERIGLGVDAGLLLKRLAQNGVDGVVVVDDCEKLPVQHLKRLITARHACSGVFLTATKVGSDTSGLLDGEDDYYLPVPHLERRPADLLFVASLIWDQLPMSPPLPEVCDQSTVEAFLEGVYANGAWTLEHVLAGLARLLETSGDLESGTLRRKITSSDVMQQLLRVMREQMQQADVAPTDAVLVVEGETDEVYLRRAGELAFEKHGWRLLDGLRIEPPAAGRGGGGSAVVDRLLELQRQGVTAIGLFDRDRPGSVAHETAGRHRLKRYQLPAKFDPIDRGEENAIIEIEDLLPTELLARFYDEHPETSPEERHWRLGRSRIVPLGQDKGALAEWVCAVATYDDLERFAYLLVKVREQLGLPCSKEMLDKRWLTRLEQRPAAT